MPKATTPGGPLVYLEDCYVIIPSFGKINFNVLPDISDQKTATYNDEAVIGRASPMKTYGSSDNRAISLQIHLVVSHPGDVGDNLKILRAIESAVYPRAGSGGAPFVPPPICQLKCGQLLAERDLCVVLTQYSVKFPTEVAWDEETFTPFKFDIDTSWQVVYKSTDLPGQARIMQLGV